MSRSRYNKYPKGLIVDGPAGGKGFFETTKLTWGVVIILILIAFIFSHLPH